MLSKNASSLGSCNLTSFDSGDEQGWAKCKQPVLTVVWSITYKRDIEMKLEALEGDYEVEE